MPVWCPLNQKMFPKGRGFQTAAAGIALVPGLRFCPCISENIFLAQSSKARDLVVQSQLWYLYQTYLKGSSDFSWSSCSMSGQLRQVFWATRSVLYEMPWQMCEGKTLIPLVALMPGVQGSIPLILRIPMYLYWPKDTERKKGLSKEESELLLLWFIPLPFLSSWTAKKTHWYWPDPLTAASTPHSLPPQLCLRLLPLCFCTPFPAGHHPFSFIFSLPLGNLTSSLSEGFHSLLQLQV